MDKRNKSLIYILALLICVLSGCGEEKESFSQKEERERLSHFPQEVPVCSEDGDYPPIEKELVENYIYSKKGKPDSKKPDSKIDTFFKNEDAVNFLKESCPDIDDWEVIYEFHDYYLRKDVYDPVNYSFRDMYMPASLVILDTDEGKGFDRLVITYFESCFLFDEGDFYLPHRDISYSVYHSYKKDWESENFEEAKKLGSGLYFDGLWFEEEKLAALFPGAGEDVLFLKNAESEPVPVFSAAECGYTLPEYKNGSRDYFLVTNENSPKGKGKLCLYNLDTRVMTPFEGAENSFPIPLEGGSFCINNGHSLAIYDLESDKPWKPAKVLESFNKKVSEIASVTTDRNKPNLHALAYKDEENAWNVAVFETDGKILTDYPLGINISYLYDYEFNFHDGIIYVDNSILYDNYRYATNVSPDVDHTCQLVMIERAPLQGETLYVKPVYYPILCGMEFEDVKDIRCWGEITERIYDMLEKDPNKTFWDTYPGGRISIDGMMEYIDLFFDVDKETVIKNTEGCSSEENVVTIERWDGLTPEMMWMSPVRQGERGRYFIVEKEKAGRPSGDRFKVYIDENDEYPFEFKYLGLEKIN